MTSVINRSCDWVRDHFTRDKVNMFSIVVILVYYYAGLLSYITVPVRPIYHFFTSSSSVAVVIRAVMTTMIVLYSLLVAIVNKEKIQWKWAVVFTYILLFTLISTIISPQTYNYIYEESLYGVVHWVKASTGFNRLFTMYLASISDFALAFCFLFILPVVINNKKQMLILFLPIVLIGLLECTYSLLREKEEYIKLINFTDPQFGGYNINIGASFGNKQDWGAFATVAFVSAVASFFFFEANNWKLVLLKIALVFSSLFIFIFTVASLCKTAIFSQLLIYLCVVIYYSYYFVKHRFLVRTIIYNTIVIGVLFGVMLFYTIPSLHSSGLLEKIYKVTYNFIIARVEGGAAGGRTAIWMRLIENFRTYNFFFGLSKGGVSTYSQVITVEGQSGIHNGIAYFFASYGLLGFSVYLILFILVIYRILALWKIDSAYVFTLFGALIAALIFSLAESEVLIVSGSNPIFVFNVLLCILPKGLITKHQKEMEAGK